MTDGGTSNPAPGMYPDPDDPSKLREWDGTAWREPSSGPAAAPTGAGGSGSGRPRWLIPLLACLALGLVVVVIGALAGSPEEDEAATDDTTTSTEAPETTDPPETTEEPTTEAPTTTEEPTTTEAPATTAEPAEPAEPATVGARVIVSRFADADLVASDVTDSSDRNCEGEDPAYGCSEWLTTDIYQIVVWDDPEVAQRYVDAALGDDTVLVGGSTTVLFMTSASTPPYDRAAYDAVLAELNAEAAGSSQPPG